MATKKKVTLGDVMGELKKVVKKKKAVKKKITTVDEAMENIGEIRKIVKKGKAYTFMTSPVFDRHNWSALDVDGKVVGKSSSIFLTVEEARQDFNTWKEGK